MELLLLCDGRRLRWSLRLTQPQPIFKPSVAALLIGVEVGAMAEGGFHLFSGSRLLSPIGTMDCVQIFGFQISADRAGRLDVQRTQVTN